MDSAIDPNFPIKIVIRIPIPTENPAKFQQWNVIGTASSLSSEESINSSKKIHSNLKYLHP